MTAAPSNVRATAPGPPEIPVRPSTPEPEPPPEAPEPGEPGVPERGPDIPAPAPGPEIGPLPEMLAHALRRARFRRAPR